MLPTLLNGDRVCGGLGDRGNRRDFVCNRPHCHRDRLRRAYRLALYVKLRIGCFTRTVVLERGVLPHKQRADFRPLCDQNANLFPSLRWPQPRRGNTRAVLACARDQLCEHAQAGVAVDVRACDQRGAEAVAHDAVALLTANTNVSLAMNADIKVERSANTTDRQDEITAYPIEYEDVALYNPTNGFAAFLIPAVLVLIIQQTLLLGIGLSAGTAREQNRFRDLVPINRHYNGTLRIVMGKGLSYFMVYSLVSVYILCVVPWLFSLNQIAIPGVLTLFTLPYLAACIFFAMTASIAIRNRETCMLLFVFTSVPLLFLSGISWPGAAMPAFWKYFSYIFPSTFGINGYVRINSMGATLNEVSFEYQALWIQTGFYFITTCLVYRWQILQSRKHVIEEYKKHKSIEA